VAGRRSAARDPDHDRAARAARSRASPRAGAARSRLPQAWVRHGTAPPDIAACIARNPGKHGIAKLRRALAADVTLSGLEDAFLDLLGKHDLPLPRTNVDHHDDRVDCHWPDRDVTVELLSYRYHATRHAFEADVARRRRSDHHAYTYGDVVEHGASRRGSAREHPAREPQVWTARPGVAGARDSGARS
jgi:hypothetical protein